MVTTKTTANANTAKFELAKQLIESGAGKNNRITSSTINSFMDCLSGKEAKVLNLVLDYLLVFNPERSLWVACGEDPDSPNLRIVSEGDLPSKQNTHIAMTLGEHLTVKVPFRTEAEKLIFDESDCVALQKQLIPWSNKIFDLIRVLSEEYNDGDEVISNVLVFQLSHKKTTISVEIWFTSNNDWLMEETEEEIDNLQDILENDPQSEYDHRMEIANTKESEGSEGSEEDNEPQDVEQSDGYTVGTFALIYKGDARP